jgi:hypothetical protein
VSDFGPGTRAEGYHKHKCQFCGFVWEHHDCNDARHAAGGAHECPGCHRCNWSLGIYVGSEEPRVRNGEAPVGAAAVGMAASPIHPDQSHTFGD